MTGTFPYRKFLSMRCFLFTVEEDMSNMVKGEGTGEGWRRVIQACVLVGKRTWQLPCPTLANSFLFPKLS